MIRVSNCQGFVALQEKAFHSLNVHKPADLSGGVWYPLEYCEKLKNNGKLQELHKFVENQSCLFGVAPKSAFTSPEANVYIAKSDLEPSHALDLLKQGPTLIDCGMAVHLSFLIALRDYIGKERFNALFSDPSFIPLHLERGSMLRPLFSLVKISDEREIEPGDFCYFSNVKEYKAKHPFGEATGYNLLNVGADRYMGFGLPPNGITAFEMKETLCDSYHQAPRDVVDYLNEKRREWYYDQSQNQEEPPPIKDCITTLENSLYPQVRRPRCDRIEQLKTAELGQVLSLFKKWFT